MQLQQIPEPFHDNRHTWFKIGEHDQLHVISGAKEKMPHNVSVHMAFSVPSVENFARRLDSLHIKYGNSGQTSSAPQIRTDGIRQIYLQDPDGYWIEVNDDKF
jgi:lactoylglutathione lyase